MKVTRLEIDFGPTTFALLEAKAEEEQNSLQNTVLRAVREYLGQPQKPRVVGKAGVRKETIRRSPRSEDK